jgi:hypothetical protein
MMKEDGHEMCLDEEEDEGIQGFLQGTIAKFL